MAVTYKKRFHLLIDRDFQAAKLSEKSGFSFIAEIEVAYE